MIIGLPGVWSTDKNSRYEYSIDIVLQNSLLHQITRPLHSNLIRPEFLVSGIAHRDAYPRQDRQCPYRQLYFSSLRERSNVINSYIEVAARAVPRGSVPTSLPSLASTKSRRVTTTCRVGTSGTEECNQSVDEQVRPMHGVEALAVVRQDLPIDH